MADVNIGEALENVRKRMYEAMKNRPDDLKYINPTLVAVSKTKPLELILDAYKAGQRHFGENYPQELISKATDERILESCPEIKWHFIGHLQSNKASKIVSLPNLYMIETVDSKKLATLLEESAIKHALPSKLKVYVQVNTSLEEDKSGVLPNEAISLSKFIIDQCPHLTFSGLMTIGKFGYDLSQGPNPDFLTLVKCKEELCHEMNLSPIDVQLSMGMSDDFVHAIEIGSGNIRVGSQIFGSRERKIEPKNTN